MTLQKRHWIISLFGMGLTLIIAGLLPLLLPIAPISAQEETPSPPSEGLYDLSTVAITPTGDNGYCAVCHNQEFKAVTLSDGFVLNLFVPPSAISNSVHGTSNEQGTLGCVDCHGVDAFPHDNLPENRRDYTIATNQKCVGCHNEQATELQNGLHERAILAGNTDAAVCTDCHGAHDVQTVAREPQLVAGVCGNCHTSTYSEWRTSPHIDVDKLGCASCHSPHAQTLRIADGNANDLCINCHKVMPDVWAHTQHIAIETNEVGCVDCHMHRPENDQTQFVSDAPTGHSMSIETIACTSCHEGLTQTISTGDTLPTLPNSEPETIHSESSVSSDTVSLLQGLILGLGFGITGAAVFITRGNKKLAEGESSHE
ncbi:MAG TPA: cytochrome c3 family protein [Aggregatilineales bacterium]|nr:cytochrome c3 family protein [Aggregatilineales bacterium]